MTYAALWNHSHYSILDSTMSVDDLIDDAAEMEMPAIGLTDRNSVADAVQFYKKAKAAGLHPVIGAEVKPAPAARPIALLAENSRGYTSLCKLLTQGASIESLAAHSEGLICLTASEENLAQYREIYGRNLAFAIAPHNEPDLRLSRTLVAQGRKLRIPIVVTANAHYRRPKDRLRYDILSSIRTLTMLRQGHPEKFGEGNYYLHSPAEIERHFGALPQAIDNSRLIAERCQFEFELGDIHFPKYDAQPGELRRLAMEGLARRYPAGSLPVDRLDRELAVIEDVGYSEYFLIFADIVRWCAANGIATLARGSAAGSLVCYALGISNVCPIRFGLMFERFLNRERMQFQKLADIDLDLPWDRRDEVIQYVFDRYGRDHVAMIGAFNTFQGRSTLIDIAKVYGIPEREVQRFTEHLPYFRGDIGAAVHDTPECKHLPWEQEPYRTILAMAIEFEGIPRHASMHPCGVVIGARPITDLMPVFTSAKGILTTQYAMDDVEELGLLKMDLLGQAGLSVLRDALANVGQASACEGLQPRSASIDLETIDQCDPDTWEMIATGHARGVFHIESPNMHNLLLATDCRTIECLTAIESVIRPGAANEGRKRAFARRHQGLEPITYPHPSLEEALKDTYGLLVYEEHILLVANGFAGMPWGRADTLRRCLVKNRDTKKIDELGAEFRACSRARGHSESETETVWETLRAFAGYMFNKAHSAAYAVEAFQGAWLKRRYPIEFLASVLSNRRGFYSPIVYVLESLRAGAEFLPPCVNASHVSQFTVRGNTVQLPLNQVKGLATATVDRIAAARPFRDIGDFFRRGKPQHAEWMALMKVGALDGFDEPRGRLFWRLCRLESVTGKGGSGATLFEPAAPDVTESGPSPRWENELLGFPVSCHPLDYYAPRLDWTRFTAAAAIGPAQFGQLLTVCGLIVADRIHPTDRGPMKFVTLADYTGFHEVALFAETYYNYGHLTVNPVIAARVKVDPNDNRKGYSLVAGQVFVPQAFSVAVGV